MSVRDQGEGECECEGECVYVYEVVCYPRLNITPEPRPARFPSHPINPHYPLALSRCTLPTQPPRRCRVMCMGAWVRACHPAVSPSPRVSGQLSCVQIVSPIAAPYTHSAFMQVHASSRD